ncbi:acyl-CoA synthetase [Antrihabitans cavernicola]|uniref:Long-chain fatty acid--CoA ligase n=1 Tax=Antrihabitans cavernicola TaxID=2495913 RepID=A0A5A7S7V4_9NOCA|nr:long-chain fatty acid--CoA ligase [Spelaeibacter cavernicola]KAA0021017.1 long-chain fatty acid--CoA ligase [Spelaeibacter cavernicola]
MDRGIGNWIPAQALRQPDKLALVDSDSGRRQTYAELNARTDRLADGLRQAGVQRGDRVALLSLNSAEFLETLFAVAKLGAVTVPINFRLAPAEVGYILADSGASVLICSEVFTDLAGAATASAGVVVTTRFVIGTEFEALVVSGSDATIECDVEESDIAVIMYTSGTTGRPKGAMLTHANMLWNAINTLTAAPEGLRRTDITIAAAPLFHIGALGVHCLPLFYIGGTSITTAAFVPDKLLKLMTDEKVSVQFLVPAMWAALAQSPALDSFDPSNVRMAVSGGAPCPLTLIELFLAKGWSFVEGFGMTETAPSCHLLDAAHIVSKSGSIGKPLRHIEFRIVDDDDTDVTVGTVGELTLRGPSLFAGYWGLPDATEAAWRGGWFHTGDLAREDEDGYVTLVDRKKDMIITGGENVYPIEVEQVLYRHPQVVEAAVIGVPNEKWGESVVAVVVTKSDPSTELADELLEYTREHLARFKCPSSVEFVDVLPRNATGKLLKRELRQTFSGTAESVSR